ncbi:sigma-70 family RNA polymerase sigma factor [Sporosalibacterium faouarense]|uniref:sigma-70 family RNA polymerase sigma factor n=1 Tax=Sporosalibacterium faouarense TaxID=516123 RepID=UPI00141D4B31|nr:sigma-70 family RNA polymerase sigma factor [Bacillota bacterium]
MADNERKLIKKCAKGDLDAFEDLISKYEKKAYNIALKILKNPEDAMDISQEAFIKVYKSIKKFKFQSSFSTWLYRIVTNTCMDFLRKNKLQVYSLDNPIKTDDGEIEREVKDNSNSTEEMYEKKMTKELVHQSIDKLDEIHRVAIILRDIEGFSYQEISEILGCTMGTVKSRISRARSSLKEIILEEMEQNDISIV